MLIRVESCWRCGWYRGISVADWAGADRFRESPLFSIRSNEPLLPSKILISGRRILSKIRSIYALLGKGTSIPVPGHHIILNVAPARPIQHGRFRQPLSIFFHISAIESLSRLVRVKESHRHEMGEKGETWTGKKTGTMARLGSDSGMSLFVVRRHILLGIFQARVSAVDGSSWASGRSAIWIGQFLISLSRSFIHALDLRERAPAENWVGFKSGRLGLNEGTGDRAGLNE
ncbi:hypothetical protein SUGI_1503780 [Cryptomeria japonica]|uniref:Uncharacterized protein n=1 Tax=Cryptomeria japonica TaxID=3369 RepID=A0AAD3NVP1_CRYJA|nr:hypothetical protein SUGI_1500440 [Cryptomeria japonica]GLJ59346.1 hypothetical protein SUGI_1503780 [Cryptomeria japonica]